MNAPETPFSDADRTAIEARLRTRQRELRSEIAGQLKHQDDPRLVGMRNRMEDTDDWAVADAMAHLDIASVSHVLSELTEVEAALARIGDGSYEECVDCGVEIPRARLLAYPAAKRCVGCQERAEASARRARGP